MAPRRADEHKIEIDPSYRRALAKRVEAIGVGKVARKAGTSRMTLWRLLTARDGHQRGTVDAAERVRRAVMELDPSGPPIPPPALPVRGPGHSTWAAALKADRKRR